MVRQVVWVCSDCDGVFTNWQEADVHATLWQAPGEERADLHREHRAIDEEVSQ